MKIPNSDQWMANAEKVIKNHISSLKTNAVPSDSSSEVQKLQAQIINYQGVIEDTVSLFYII